MRRGRKNILIVDPDEKFRGRLSSALKNRKHNIEQSVSFYDAVKMLSESRFDCLVVNVCLPDFKAHEGLSIVRNMNPETRIIATTDKNSRDLESGVREQNVYYYFIKSFPEKELVQAVKSALRKRRKKAS